MSYWINALGGAPLLCLHKALDPKLVKALEHDVVPQLLELGVLPATAPDLTQPECGAPALTLVFDREGWSPDCSSAWPGAASPASPAQELQGRSVAAARLPYA